MSKKKKAGRKAKEVIPEDQILPAQRPEKIQEVKGSKVEIEETILMNKQDKKEFEEWKQSKKEIPGTLKQIMVKTHDMAVSGKLQKQGCRIVAVTGGTDDQVKMHYLAITKDKAIENLKEENEKLDMSIEKKKKLNEKEIATLVETDTIEKTKFPVTDLKERLDNSPKVKDIKGEPTK